MHFRLMIGLSERKSIISRGPSVLDLADLSLFGPFFIVILIP